MGKWGPVTPLFITLLDGVHDTRDRGHQGFLEILQEGHPFLEVEDLIEQAIKAQRYCNLLLMAVGFGYYFLLRLGWQAFAVLHLWIITRVLGNLAGSLGKDAILSDVLQELDEHLGIIMMFNALSKECYSLKQGRGGCGCIWGVLVTAGPDTPVGVPRKDPARACGGDVVQSLQWGP